MNTSPRSDENQALSFPSWHEQLLAAGLPAGRQNAYFEAIRAFLLVEGGADIRTVQDLLGHESVETTQINNVMQKPGLGVRSPLDR